MKNNKILLPNCITLLNLFFGFWGIVMVGRGQYTTACWLILVASILDVMDGALARLVRSSSPFGAQVDSLSDLTSFGVAPAYLVYKAALEPLGILGLIIAFLPLVLGASRLARFNVTNGRKQSRKFIGMPIPASALLLSGYYLYTHVGLKMQGDMRVWLSLVPIASALMISPIPYWKAPKLIARMVRMPFTGLPVVIAGTVGMLWKPALTLFPLMIIYVIISPVEWGISQLRRIKEETPEELLETDPHPSKRRFLRRRR